MQIKSFEYDLENDHELMEKKRTNADIAKVCIKHFKMVIKALEELE